MLTDASAVHLLKLKKLKSIILNGPKMTAAWHGNLSTLPLESLSVSQGNALLPKVEVGIGESLNLIRFMQYSAKYRALNWLPAGYIVVWPEVR